MFVVNLLNLVFYVILLNIGYRQRTFLTFVYGAKLYMKCAYGPMFFSLKSTILPSPLCLSSPCPFLALRVHPPSEVLFFAWLSLSTLFSDSYVSCTFKKISAYFSILWICPFVILFPINKHLGDFQFGDLEWTFLSVLHVDTSTHFSCIHTCKKYLKFSQVVVLLTCPSTLDIISL